MNYKQTMQKIDFSLSHLEYSIEKLILQNDFPPCLVISGLRHLSLAQMVKHHDYKSIIFSLFNLLNIPLDYILYIKHASYTKFNEEKIPFDAYIYLIDEHLKIKVYKLLLNHIKRTKQTKIHLKMIN